MSGEMPYESDPLTAKLNELVVSQELYFNLLDFESLSLAEKVLIGTWELVNEVYNGGFMQYFHNSSGEHARPMVAVLRVFEAQQAADILQEAISLAGPGTPWGDMQDYLAAMKAMPADVQDRIGELERKFYDELDNLHLQIFQYLSKHRDQIGAPEDFWREGNAP